MFGEQMLAGPGRFNESQSGLMNYGWRFVTLYRRQELRPSPRKRNGKKAKWLSRESLQTTVKRREAKSKEKRKDIPI